MIGFKKKDKVEDTNEKVNTISSGMLQFKKELPELPSLMIP